MPAENRVWSEERADFAENLPAEHLAFDGQTAALVIVEQNAFLAELLAENLILGTEIRDHVLLLPIDPARKNEKVQLPRLKDELHACAALVE